MTIAYAVFSAVDVVVVNAIYTSQLVCTYTSHHTFSADTSPFLEPHVLWTVTYYSLSSGFENAVDKQIIALK